MAEEPLNFNKKSRVNGNLEQSKGWAEENAWQRSGAA